MTRRTRSTVERGGARVLSVYDGFFTGGARIQHTTVVTGLHATTQQRHSVLGLARTTTREGTTQTADRDGSWRRLAGAGVPVGALDRASGSALRRHHLAALERAVGAADLVLSLKEQPLAALRRIDAAGTPVVVSLHRSDPEHHEAAVTDLVDLVDRGTVAAAVCCARSTQRAYHAATGIPLAQLPVVPNGVDLQRFRPSACERRDVRRELGIDPAAPVVLLSARFDPMKDVPLFLRAAAAFARRRPDAHVVLCGAGMSAANPELAGLVSATLRGWSGAQDRVHLLGIRADMPRLHNAADVVALTSAYGEAAPLSLLEAMASGTVPVTTDVGDAAAMVGDARLVTGREPGAVALAWEAALDAREEHLARILRDRPGLSERHCVDAYAAIAERHALRDVLPTAV
ncbi:glycosyltransferase [Nocardioides sp. Arc9.136]|uniref:glycosyltransferase n=1 Tax=Nocardioides sp. Arc9.136 TaxID=2996826 RepID=UPI002666B249|nr:glycosyltransferase [Nocardioides sp. Arc9.136]WKN48956.1 glycosyltransferase [Nocardioides sp. Arc9.136]